MSDLKEEKDQFAIDKKHLLKDIKDMESQLEWLKSEKDEKITKLTAEKRSLQDRVHEMEAQLLQLKSRQKDELKASIYDIKKNIDFEALRDNTEELRKILILSHEEG